MDLRKIHTTVGNFADVGYIKHEKVKKSKNKLSDSSKHCMLNFVISMHLKKLFGFFFPQV